MRYKSLMLRGAVPWLAQLAVFALVFQISALDHHFQPAAHLPDLVGIHGSSEHAVHCRGGLRSGV